MDTIIPMCDTSTSLLTGLPLWIPLVIAFLAIWEIVWIGLALWKASQNDEKTWFVFLLLFNTVGILPILYLKFFQNRRVAI